MFLKELSVKNFMPFKGEHKLDFLEDSFRNVTLVFADNMRGKTSLLNAIRWAFYDRALDRYGEAIPLTKLLNIDARMDGASEFEVKVSFSHAGKSYELLRSAELKNRLGPKGEEFQTKTILRCDGEIERGDRVPHIIGQIVPDQISRFFLFDGELLQEYESLLADDEEQGRRIKEAIEQVLGVPALVQGRDDLRSLGKRYEKAQMADLRRNNAISDFLAKLAKITKEREIFEKDVEAIGSSLSTQRHEYHEVQARVDDTEAKFKQKVDLDSKINEKKLIASNLHNLTEQTLSATRDAWKDLCRPLLEKEIERLDASEEKIAVEINVACSRQVEDHQLATSVASKSCVLCNRPLDNTLLAYFQSRLSLSHVLDIERLAVQLSDMKRVSRRVREIKYPQSKRIYAELRKQILRQTIEQTRLDSDIDRIRKELEGFDTDEIQRLRRKAENLHFAIRQMENRLEECQKKLSENRQEEEEIRLVINQNESARDNRSSRLVNLIKSLEKVFLRATDRLREELRSEVERRASDAFRTLTTDVTYRGLRINKNYGLTIIDEKDREVTLRSAGAEQIVALSLIDGLNRTGRSAGPVVMDTPFGRLDPKHRDRVLGHLPESSSQVILLVHEGELRKSELGSISARVGLVYEIEYVSSSQSRIVRK